MTDTCRRCKRNVPSEELIGRMRGVIADGKICRACVLKRHKKQTRDTLLLYTLIIVGTAACFISVEGRILGWRLAELLTLVALLYVLTACHLLAQIFVAKGLGLVVTEAIVGSGEDLFSIGLFGVMWQVKRSPFGHRVRMMADTEQWFRTRNILAVFAGPVLSLALALLGLSMLDVKPRSERLTYQGIHFGWGLWLAGFCVVLESLWPWKLYRSMLIPVDARRLFTLLRMKKNEMKQEIIEALDVRLLRTIRNGKLDEALNLCNDALRRYPEDPTLLRALSYIYWCLGRIDDARQVELNVMELPDIEESQRDAARNGLAYYNALSGQQEFLAEADKHSEEIYKDYPWFPYFMGTRGIVLMKMGKLDEAEILLKDAIEFHHEPEEKSELYYHLGHIAQIRGNPSLADHYFKRARKLFPNIIQQMDYKPANERSRGLSVTSESGSQSL